MTQARVGTAVDTGSIPRLGYPTSPPTQI